MRYPRYSMLSIIFSPHGSTFAVVLLGVMIPTAVIISFSWSAWRLEQDGVDTWATVRNLQVEERRCNSGKHSRTTCEIHRVGFVFVDTYGRTVAHTQTVALSVYETMKIGKEIPVRYVPDDVETAKINNGNLRGNLRLNLAVLAALVLTSAFGFASRLKAARRLVAVRYSGESRQATVTDVVRNTWKINGLSLHRIVWRDESGQTGTSLGRFKMFLPEIGATITVFADVAGGGEAVWEGDSGSR